MISQEGADGLMGGESAWAGLFRSVQALIHGSEIEGPWIRSGARTSLDRGESIERVFMVVEPGR